MFLGVSLYSLSACLHTGVQMGTEEFNAEGNTAMDKHPIQEGVEIAWYSWMRYLLHHTVTPLHSEVPIFTPGLSLSFDSPAVLIFTPITNLLLNG